MRSEQGFRATLNPMLRVRPAADPDNGLALRNSTTRVRRCTFQAAMFSADQALTSDPATPKHLPEPEQGLPQSPSKQRLARDIGWTGLPARRSSGLAALLRADLRVPASLTRKPDNWNADMSTPDRYDTTGAHLNLPLLYGPSFGCQPADSDSDPLHNDPFNRDSIGRLDTQRPSQALARSCRSPRATMHAAAH